MTYAVSRLLVLLKHPRSKQCVPRSDCSTEISPRREHLHAADDFSRRHFQMHVFRSRRRVNREQNII